MTHVIGIIGAGHLGRTLATVFRNHGIPENRIRISYGGNPATREEIRAAGFEANIADNREICRTCQAIFITVRPQSVGSLDSLPFPNDGLIVSSMAAIPRDLLTKRWGVPVVRMMPSGPDSILGGNGIAAIYPENDRLAGLLRLIGLSVLSLPDEDAMNVFTAGVCLPPAILAAEVQGRDITPEVPELAREFPLIGEMYPWARNVLPDIGSDTGRDTYITKMSTKGGITEAIVASIRSGATLAVAMQAGIARSREISRQAGTATAHRPETGDA
ncbi:MAG: NAD(P)-binding domain-containing protein [Methanoregulaceae archaeon]